jgi:hypothetical protein
MKSKMCLTCTESKPTDGAKSRWDRDCTIAKKSVRGMDVCPKTAGRKPRKRELARKEKEAAKKNDQHVP